MRDRVGWHPAHWLESPHRLGFVAAAAVMTASAAGWVAVWLGTGAKPQAPTAVPLVSLVTAHALLFVFGFLPLFFAGFLFTVGPRWLALPVTPTVMHARTRALLWPTLSLAAAWLAWWPLVWLGERGAPALLLALALAASGWTAIVVLLWRQRLQPSPRPSGALTAAVWACTLGAVWLWLAVAAMAAGRGDLLQRLPAPALWTFVGGVFAAASARMLPLESMLEAPGGVTPRAWAVPALLGSALVVGGVSSALPAPGVVLATVLAAALTGAAAVSALIAWRWLRRQPLRAQLVAMLQVGWFWWTLALTLQATALWFAVMGRPDWLGAAPLHALALGWMGSTLFAMASRVSGAFSGQRRIADTVAWWLFAGVQTAAVARVAAALWPAATLPLGTLAACAWALAAAGWLVVYGRWLGLPAALPKRRPDAGKRGPL